MKYKTAAVSVIIPLYNKEKEVGRAIDSILNQTFQDFEIIVVNDGSTDKGPEIVRGFEDNRIRMIDQENQGVSAARNQGIKDAKSDLIAFLDADDEWMPYFLETILKLRAKFPSCEVFATNYIFQESPERCYRTKLRGILPGEGVLKDYFGVAAKSDPPLWTSGTTVTKKAIASVCFFPIGVTSGEDLLTWARLALKYNIAYNTRPCVIFWKPLDINIKPRVPQMPDIVGRELKSLIEKAGNAHIKKLKRYTSVWYKMRANAFLRLGNHCMAFKEIMHAFYYSKRNLKNYIYLLFVLIPLKYEKILAALYVRSRKIINRNIIKFHDENGSI